MKLPSFRHIHVSAAACLILLEASAPADEPKAPAAQPRIVNLYNFIRNSDYRLQNSEEILFQATKNQIDLIKPTGMPVTWALQYDALINPKYQKLLKEEAGPHDEIAAWWEIPRPLVEKAGLKWRGHDHEWDSTANVGFSPGYTPEERKQLVDVYMADFKAIYGRYPQSVGSWYIDEVTLDYMAKRYGIIASCNCKDQIGTDGYTLWGGYWNQAYYPSKVNAYMPAQTKEAQIDVPIFRMLGSDPIYQYGAGHGISSLEPVYGQSGGSETWVKWLLKNMTDQPSLAFAYTQAGQENSFGWDGMKNGLIMQVKMLSEQSKAGKLQVMTLADAGRWFKSKYPLTPPTSMVYLDDWKNENRKTVWYNSRYYRLNCLWENGGFFIRDIHRFDEKIESVTHDLALEANTLACTTLPVMDGEWSSKEPAGIRPVLLSDDGKSAPMTPEGPPVVKELNATDLSIRQPLAGGGSFVMVCREAQVDCLAVDGSEKPLHWAWEFVGGDKQKTAVQKVEANGITYRSGGVKYEIHLSPNTGSCQQLPNGIIRMTPNASGKLALVLGNR